MESETQMNGVIVIDPAPGRFQGAPETEAEQDREIAELARLCIQSFTANTVFAPRHGRLHPKPPAAKLPRN